MEEVDGIRFRMFINIALIFIAGSGISSCEERIRRQIWGSPPNPNPFWGNNLPGFGNNGGFYDRPIDPWAGTNSFQQPQWNQNNFGGARDVAGFDGFEGNQGNRKNFGNVIENVGFGGFEENEGNRNDFNGNKENSFGGSGNNKNQNKRKKPNQNRKTTKDPRPLTTTPRTIHYAPKNCDCPMTQQFNPVCGTDGNTYRNEGLLNCYKRCGTRVTQKRLGTC